MFCSLDILEDVKWDKVLLNLDEEMSGVRIPRYTML